LAFRWPRRWKRVAEADDGKQIEPAKRAGLPPPKRRRGRPQVPTPLDDVGTGPAALLPSGRAAPAARHPASRCFVCSSAVHSTKTCPLLPGDFWRDASRSEAQACLRRIGAVSSGALILPSEAVKVEPVAADGDCMFTAIGLQHMALAKKKLALPSEKRSVGQTYRAMCMRLMRDRASGGKMRRPTDELPLALQIRASTGMSPPAYFAMMSVGDAANSKSWGGILEASTLAERLGLRIAIVEPVEEGFAVLVKVGAAGSELRIGLVWTGAHYTIARISDGRAWT